MKRRRLKLEFTKKNKKGMLIGVGLVLMMVLIPFMSTIVKADIIETYNANEWSPFKNRTKEDIGKKYTEARKVGATYRDGVSSTYYQTAPSLSAPYAYGELTQDTHDAMTAMTNYYRWLVGVESLTKGSIHSDALQAGALIRKWEFSHHPSSSSKPADMADSLWNQGANVTHNILAWGTSPRGSITSWLDEGYCQDVSLCQYKGINALGFTDTTIGHRMHLIGQNISSVQFGYAGVIAIGAAEYNNTTTQAYTAYPSPGYMPYNDLPVATSSWDIELNPNVIIIENLANVTVKVTNLNTNKSYDCTTSNGKLSTYDYISRTLNFAQPPTTNSNDLYSEGDKYKVEVTGLKNKANNNEAKIEYTTEFFDVTKYTKEIANITVTSPTKNTYKIGDSLNVNGGKVKITYQDNTTSTIDLTEEMVSNFSTTTKGASKAVVTYSQKTATFDYLVVANPEAITANYGDTLGNLTIPGDDNGTYSFLDAGTTSVGETGSHTFGVSYTPKNNKYSTLNTLDITVNVEKATPSYNNKITVNATYGETLADVTLPSSDTGTYVFEQSLSTSVGNVGENTEDFTVKFVPTDSNKYKTVENIPVTMIVSKQVAPPITIPTLSSITYNADTKLSNISLPAGWSWDTPEIVPTVGNTGYKATFTPSDMGNYDYSSQDLNPTLTLIVNKAIPMYSAPTVIAYKDDILQDVALPTSSIGTYTWQDPASTSVGDIGTHIFKVTFTPNDTVNYETVTDINATVEVGKTKPNYTVPTNLVATYGDTLMDITLPTGFTWNDSSNTSVGNAGEHTFLATFTPDDTTNYAVVTNIEIKVYVNKKQANAISVPTISDMTYDETRKLSDIALPAGWSWDTPDIIPTVGNTGYKATYTPADSDNYDYSSQNLNPSLVFVVNKKTPSYTVPSNLEAYWGSDLSEVLLPTGFSFQDTGLVGEVGNRTVRLTYTPADSINYLTINDIEVTLTIKKAIPTVDYPIDFVIDEEEGLVLSDISLPEGWEWENPNAKLVNSGKYKAVFIPDDTEHYAIIEKDVSITFKRDIPQASIPEKEESEQNSINPPNTGDDILKWIILCFISIISMIGNTLNLKRQNG